MLTAHNLTYQINGNPLVHNVSFELRMGEVLALVGPNGAGKSTLLRMLCGDLHPTAGQVTLDNIPLSGYKPKEMALKRAVMSQHAPIAFEFTVEEVAMMGRYPHQQFGNGETDEDRRIVEAVLEKSETLHLRHRFYPTLSGGEAARVTLARVLAQQTPILLLDEPTAALDLRHQQLVMKVARELAASGASVLAILHDLNLAAAHADRIGMMLAGKMVALGTPGEVLTEANIETVFNLPVTILPHPHLNCPLIVPLMPDRIPSPRHS